MTTESERPDGAERGPAMAGATCSVLDADRMVEVGGAEYRVHAEQTAGTRSVRFRAWEPTAYAGSHGTVTSFGEHALAGVWGAVDTRRPPAETLALRAGSPERVAAVEAHYVECRFAALAAIREAFPWVAEVGHVDGGEVWATVAEVVAHEPDMEGF